MNELYIYTSPVEADVQLTLDHGAIVIVGELGTANGRDDAHLLQLPADTVEQGAALTVTCEDFVPLECRGIVVPDASGGEAKFLFDDARLVPVPVPAEPKPPLPPDGGPSNPSDPHAVILWVFDSGLYDLSNTKGCGLFVEACALALFTYTAPTWGHVQKFPGQNQWNGHAVDAVHSLAGEFVGIWDIIVNSEVPGATPAFNYSSPADPAIWYPGNQTAPPATRTKR